MNNLHSYQYQKLPSACIVHTVVNTR